MDLRCYNIWTHVMLRCVTACPCLQMGLGLAVEYALQVGMDTIWERVQFLAADLRLKLETVAGVTMQDKGRLLCGIVSFTLVSPAGLNFLFPRPPPTTPPLPPRPSTRHCLFSAPPQRPLTSFSLVHAIATHCTADHCTYLLTQTAQNREYLLEPKLPEGFQVFMACSCRACMLYT